MSGTGIDNSFLQALTPLLKSLQMGSTNLIAAAEQMSTSLGRAVSVPDLVQGLRALEQAGGATGGLAGTVLTMAQACVDAANLAGTRAVAPLLAAGASAAEIAAVRLAAQRAVLQVSLRALSQRGAAAIIADALAALARGGTRAVFLGLSVGAWLLLGIGVGAVMIGGYVWSRGEAPIEPGVRMTGAQCPDMTPRPHNCPWTPADAGVGSCPPGSCFDGGYNHSDACKPENQSVPNAHATDLNDMICNDGFPTHVRDPCTGLLLRCDP